jgi:hypothetical protein
VLKLQGAIDCGSKIGPSYPGILSQAPKFKFKIFPSMLSKPSHSLRISSVLLRGKQEEATEKLKV